MLLVVATLSVRAQTAEDLKGLPPHVDQPPEVLPADCPAGLPVQASLITGSKSYVRLKQEIKTMEIGHHASQLLMSALSTRDNSSATVGAAWLHIAPQFASAENGYLCASFLAGRITTADAHDADPESVMIHTLISVFNRMALQTVMLRSQMQTVAEAAESGQDPMPVAVANRISSTLQDRKEAGDDFQNVINLSALMTVDTDDPTATKADTLNISYGERKDLLQQVTGLAESTPVDEFTRGAKQLKEFLATYQKCKPK